MSFQRTLARVLGAAVSGLALVAACAGAAPSSEAANGAWTPGVEEAAKRAPTDRGERAPTDAGAPGDDGGPRCPYGSLEDPHRGFVRCLTPDERDAGWLPPPPQGEPPPQALPPDADAGKPSGALPIVEVGAPKFENGEVPRTEKAMNKAAADIARCVADNGGLSGDAGSLKIQFLVRARARAEGVEVLAAKGVSADAQACVRKLLKNKPIGAPTSDPVGVTVVLSLRPAK